MQAMTTYDSGVDAQNSSTPSEQPAARGAMGSAILINDRNAETGAGDEGRTG